MFIPRNEPVHKNLSTSYILVESLVDDLREGGFSGVVETTLREGDLFIVFSQGTILAAGSPGAGGPRLSIPDIASRCRRERGRLSIYAGSPEVSAAIAGRLFAKPLYSK